MVTIPRALALALSLLAAAPAGATTVEAFLLKADALRAKSVMALFSPDYKLLKNEVVEAGKAWRVQAPAARPAVCAPAKAAMDQDYVMGTLKAVPPAERPRAQVKDVLIRSLNERYRCR